MTREIKFRAKNTKNEWVYGDYAELSIHDDYLSPSIIDTGFIQSINPETRGQFTGMADKNGKEIYEGDVAQCILKNKYQVIFNEEWAAFMLNRLGENMVIYPNMDIEIIGNIHENPELLEGK